MPEPSNGQATPAAAASTGQDPAGHTGGGPAAKPDDTRFQLANVWIQLAGVLVSLAALGVAVVAVMNANGATSHADQAAAHANRAAAQANRAAAQANRLAASVASAHLHLASAHGLKAHLLAGGAKYGVTLDLADAGGTALAIKAWLGTVPDIHRVSFAQGCPKTTHIYYFEFPAGTTLGSSDTLSGMIKGGVPKDVLPPGGTPTNSMMLYASWQNLDGSKPVNCENLSNEKRIGGLATHPR